MALVDTALLVKVTAAEDKTRQRGRWVNSERKECGNWSLRGETDLAWERKEGQEKGHPREA